MAESASDQTDHQAGPPRRSFLTRMTSGIVALLACTAPIASGLVAFFDPLRRKAQGGGWTRVALLDAVPADGKPYRFPVIREGRRDAWSKYPPEPIGSIYLRRSTPEDKPVAFSSICPHLGCSVEFKSSDKVYLCACHNAYFKPDGARVDPEVSQSPRDLDELAVEVRNETEVWVDYQQFKQGIAEKIAE